MRQTTKATVGKARALRRIMTPPEAMLWTLLRARPANLKFRRQHPAGPYVIDFYCPAAKLGIEIDGAAHDMGDIRSGTSADLWLRERGYRILRIPAAELLGNAEDVLRHILDACAG